MDFGGVRFVVVGSGFFGSVIAERIAQDMDERVIVVEKRNHVGGNSYSEIDPVTGIEAHVYGSHIFHTSSREVWDYITSFDEFNHYCHKVLALYKGQIYQIPVNLNTINSFYGKRMAPGEACEFIRDEAALSGVGINARNFEEKALSTMGKPLYEAFIKGYTKKQWGIDPCLLPASILNRIPLQYNYEAAYFPNQFQGVPLSGYGNLFRKILNHKNISVYLNTDFFSMRKIIPKDAIIIFSGPIDSYFNYKYGILGWRTQDFEKEILNIEDFQGTAVVNYVEEEIPFTRVHEFKHYHPERPNNPRKTLIFREFSRAAAREDEPFYPTNTEQDKNLFTRYQEEAKKEQGVIFGGRLGSYKYLNMDETIYQALEIYEKCIKRRSSERG
jgi:UDP-galactopyranose mutase